MDNPAARVLIDISKVQDAEVGDGTTSVVVLAGELLREAEQLVNHKARCPRPPRPPLSLGFLGGGVLLRLGGEGGVFVRGAERSSHPAPCSSLPDRPLLPPPFLPNPSFPQTHRQTHPKPTHPPPNPT